MATLRLIIKHPGINQFCTCDGTWTAEETEAKTFSNVLEAFDFASQHKITDIDVKFRQRVRPVLQRERRALAAETV